MKDSTDRSVIVEEIVEWWDFLSIGQKVATVWLSIVAVVLLIVGITFPIVGLVLAGLVVIFGSIAALISLFE